MLYVSNEKIGSKRLFRGFVGDCTTQSCGDCNALEGSLLNHRDSMESKAVFFFVAHISFWGADPHFHTAFR